MEMDIQVIPRVLFVILVILPILLAWLKGDQILDRIAARQKASLRNRRKRTTRALPLRKDTVRSILDAEEKCDEIDNRIAHKLGCYQDLYTQTRDSEATSLPMLADTENLLLSRESHFNSYLDIAWLQSETIEILSEEVALLREFVQLGPHQRRPSSPEPAANQLIQNLESAIRKRADVDRKLGEIGKGNSSKDTSPGFDATVG